MITKDERSEAATFVVKSDTRVQVTSERPLGNIVVE